MTLTNYTGKSRTITIIDDNGAIFRTSIRLEQPEWDILEAVCAKRNIIVDVFCQLAIEKYKNRIYSRTAQIRTYLLEYCFEHAVFV